MTILYLYGLASPILINGNFAINFNGSKIGTYIFLKQRLSLSKKETSLQLLAITSPLRTDEMLQYLSVNYGAYGLTKPPNDQSYVAVASLKNTHFNMHWEIILGAETAPYFTSTEAKNAH